MGVLNKIIMLITAMVMIIIKRFNDQHFSNLHPNIACAFSDSGTRNPMVAGFAEDLDSEDESTTVTAAIANQIENSNVNYPSKTVGKAVVVSVDLTSSEEEEIVEKSDDEKERNEKEWEKNEDERSTDKEDKESKSNGVKLSKEMPAISSWTGTSIDGFGPGAEGFDDWLNSPGADLKVRIKATVLIGHFVTFIIRVSHNR